MSAPVGDLLVRERARGERLVVRRVPWGRDQGVEFVVERREGDAWVRRYYLTVPPGELFDLSDALVAECTRLTGGVR